MWQSHQKILSVYLIKRTNNRIKQILMILLIIKITPQFPDVRQASVWQNGLVHLRSILQCVLCQDPKRYPIHESRLSCEFVGCFTNRIRGTTEPVYRIYGYLSGDYGRHEPWRPYQVLSASFQLRCTTSLSPSLHWISPKSSRTTGSFLLSNRNSSFAVIRFPTTFPRNIFVVQYSGSTHPSL